MDNLSFTVCLTMGGVILAVGFVILLVLLTSKRSINQRFGIVDTGLKAVDLLVPIPVGRNVLVSGDKGAGVRLLATEIAYRLANLPRDAFRVMIYLDPDLDELQAIRTELHESLPGIQTIFVTPAVTSQDIRQQRSLPSVLGRDAVFVISNHDRFVHLFGQAIRMERDVPGASMSLTTFTVTEVSVAEEFDAKLISSRLLAKEAIYPALDFRYSFSVGSSHASVKSRRRRVAAAVKLAVNEVVENLVPGCMNDPTWSFQSDSRKRAAVQSLWFLSQPYFVAVPYTGGKSMYVPINVAVKDLETILAGRFADAPFKRFAYQNALQANV